MNHRIIAVFLLGLATVCSAQQLPAGWSRPPVNLSGQQFREKDPNHFLVVKGEFNGDGLRDEALLLVNQHTQKLGFFVCLTTATGCDWHRLVVMDIPFLDVMGIAKVKPGDLETACGKGYWECGNDEPKKLKTSATPWRYSRTQVPVRYTSTTQAKHKFVSFDTSD